MADSSVIDLESFVEYEDDDFIEKNNEDDNEGKKIMYTCIVHVDNDKSTMVDRKMYVRSDGDSGERSLMIEDALDVDT